MSDVSASAVAALRKRTGVSIIECKKALEEAAGDEEKAIEILRSRGQAQAVKKSDREQGEGYIFSAQTDGKAALVILHNETDFVSRNDDFQAFGAQLATCAVEEGKDAATKKAEEQMSDIVQQLGENITLGEITVVEGGTVGSYVHTNGKIGVLVSLDGGTSDHARDVAMHAAAMNPGYVTPEEVSDDDVAKEKALWEEQLKAEGKPAEIMDKIMVGKEKKFREENALMSQPFVKDPEQTITTYLDGASVDQYIRVAVGG